MTFCHIEKKRNEGRERGERGNLDSGVGASNVCSVNLAEGAGAEELCDFNLIRVNFDRDGNLHKIYEKEGRGRAWVGMRERKEENLRRKRNETFFAASRS